VGINRMTSGETPVSLFERMKGFVRGHVWIPYVKRCIDGRERLEPLL
jgi:hypothetical protein